MIDLNSTKTLRHHASDELTAHINQVAPPELRRDMLAHLATLTPVDEEERWGRSISASAVGDECARRVQLGVWPTFHPQARVPRRAPLDAKTRLVFARGHATEEWMAGWLRDAGFPLSTHTQDSHEAKQHGFITANGQIKGYADGRFMPPPRRLWEHKTLGFKGFRKIWNHGLEKAYPHYDAQAQMLMAYMDAEESLFTILCADGADAGEIYAEVVPFDAAKAQVVSDRAVHILQATRAGDLLPKIGADADYFACRFCRFKEECWGPAVDTLGGG